MFLAKEKGYFEIIIYIIAMVVGLAANAYRNYNKRKERETQAELGEEMDETDVIFEPVEESAEMEIPRYIFEAEEEEAIDNKDTLSELPIEEKVSPEPDAVIMAMDEQQKSNSEAFFFSEDQTDQSVTVYDNDISDMSSNEDEEKENFDLEKAVIYAEILKPKYINNSY